MPLFRRNNTALKFDIVGLSDEAMTEITALVVQNGGKVVHDERQPIKFTKPFQFVENAFPGFKLYDIEFIKKCIEQNVIVDPISFRIGKPHLYDDCVMAHFLGATCGCCTSNRCTELTERYAQTGSTTISSPKRRSESEDNKNLSLVNLVAERRQQIQNQATRGRKRGRGLAITRAEELRVLEYLTQNRVILEAGTGLQVWEEIINFGICPRRTPNSLYSHFKKSMLPNITHYSLTESQLKQFNKIKDM